MIWRSIHVKLLNDGSTINPHQCQVIVKMKNPVGIHMYKYLPGVGSAGTKLLFTFKSWIHGKLGRHRGREGKSECKYCTLSIVRVFCVSF